MAIRVAAPSTMAATWEGGDHADFQGVTVDEHNDVVELYDGVSLLPK